MADLKSFSKDKKTLREIASGNRASGQRATRREPGEAPSGYDQDLWTLAIRFQRCALADGIALAADLPVIHDVLKDLVSLAGIRGRRYRQEVRGCRNRTLDRSYAAKCWYHWPPGRPGEQQARDISWQQLVEVTMAEFWSRIQNEYALDQFRRDFAEYGRAALRHWEGLAFAQRVEPKPRVIMRRDEPRGTMNAASKEG